MKNSFNDNSMDMAYRDGHGLTDEEKQAVIIAQDTYSDKKLFAASQKWTRQQRKFARLRYMSKHRIYPISR